MASLITVIVPIYNAEPYLRRCLDSLRVQSLSEFEVIMVDDGSTDASVAVCLQMEKDDHRFHLHSQRHAGCSAARNFGLSLANGQYIVFVDADDYVKPSYLAHLYQRVVETGADLVIQGHNRVTGNHSLHRGVCPDAAYSLSDNPEQFFTNFSVVTSGSVCAKLFLSDPIRQHRLAFNSKVILAEDMGFLMDYLLVCSLVALDSHVDYDYIGNPQSSSTYYCTYPVEESGYLILSELWQRMLDKYSSAALRRDYSVFVGNYINRMIFSVLTHPATGQQRALFLQQLQSHYYPSFLSEHQPESVFRYVLKWTALHHAYGLYVLAMRLSILRYHLPVNYR